MGERIASVRTAVVVLAAVLLAAGCGTGGTLTTHQGGDGGGVTDGGGQVDGGGTNDGGVFDGGGDGGTVVDGGGIDGGTPDGGVFDGGVFDGGTPDGGVLDGGYGAPVSGYPSWSERAFLVLVNAVRMAPTAYRDGYMTDLTATHTGILAPASFPAAPPLYDSFDLDRAARFHSSDLANTSGCAFGHASCDGTAWNVRIHGYDPGAQTLGENIAAGDPDPRRMLDFLLCDAPAGSTTCCADTDTTCNGHRANIMQAGFTVSGVGYASGGNQYKYYWTEDFATDAPVKGGPIVAGGHDLVPTQGDVGFFMNYDDSAGAPQSVDVVIDGTPHPMTTILGPAAAGTYVYETSVGGNGAACKLYYFEAVDSAGKTWRYPNGGSFVTAGVGACTADQNWQP